MRVIHEETGLGIIDTLVALMMIAILIGAVIPRYQRLTEEARESALQIGLGNIRKGITVYVLINQRIPSDLRDLYREKVIVTVKGDTIFSAEYLKALAMDEEGFPVDPFGNRYTYDPGTGRVSSTTEGYEEW